MAFAHLLLLVFAPLMSAQETTQSLAGEWRVRLDPEGSGQIEQWFAAPIDGEEIALPGTTDLAGLGNQLNRQSMCYDAPFVDSVWPGVQPTIRADETGHLLREFMYIGKAWYQRDFVVPEDWQQRRLFLHLERVMWKSEVWIDEQYFGSNDSLTTAHEYDLRFLQPGKHRLTVCVDNGMVHDIGILGHAYGPETQSRWNGMIGDLKLTAKPKFHLQDLRVHAPADGRKLRVDAVLHHLASQPSTGKLQLQVVTIDGGQVLATRQMDCNAAEASLELQIPLPVEAPIQTWNEFTPQQYRLIATLESEHGRDQMEVAFGFRSVERKGNHILVNGDRVFLRGTLDCAVYPRTGHPPTTVEEWRRTLTIIRDYGFNHVRFHSWCPPRAAFEAADELGIYLCPETPFWVDNWTSEIGLKPKLLGFNPRVTDFVRREIRRIHDAYGNHPSFALFCIGNEFGMSTDWNVVQELVAESKRHDSRKLHLGSTARKHVAADDYWVTHRTDRSVRGTGPAHTDWDHDEAVATTEMPVVAHETGQHPVFPDYPKLLPKFDGPLLPVNYERLWNDLQNSGMQAQLPNFVEASARGQMLQYKAEHEGMLRTSDFAGYQLLMLNDFTGQSEALVGVLDPFWDSKGIFTADDLRQWNSPEVPLARISKFVWSNDELFQASFEFSHFGPQDLKNATIQWSLTSDDGAFQRRRNFPHRDLPRGGLHELGKIEIPLHDIHSATALTLRLQVGSNQNEWKIWVYPPSTVAPGNVHIRHQFDTETQQLLADGGKVLLLPTGLKNPLVKQTGFASVYWSAGWWGDNFSHLGMICQQNHPALSNFPSEGFADWQWHELMSNATTFHLQDPPANSSAPQPPAMPDDFRPILQPVPDFHFNQRLAQLFQTKFGQGKLMVCGYDLSTRLQSRPAARQLRSSLLQYMQSNAFQPAHELDAEFLQKLLTSTP
jgi:beta-galactosidase